MFAVPAMAPVCLFFPLLSLLKALRRLVTVSGVESASEGARQKTHRPSVGPAVTQHEVLILTGDIMSLQRYRPELPQELSSKAHDFTAGSSKHARRTI